MTLRVKFLLGTALVSIAAGTSMLAPAVAAPADPTHYLLNQAEYWHEKGRNDLSIQALERILSFEQNQPDALYYLAIYSAQDGKSDAAEQWGRRFEQVAPVDPRIDELKKALHLGSTGAWKIADARRLAAQGALSDAVRAYQQAFGNGLIPYDYASEYYLTLAGTKWGWNEAANGLAQMVASHPTDHALALAFGKVLSYREETRRQAINVLLGLDENNPAVYATLRQALIWLNAKPDDASLFEAYLRDHPDDREIAAQLAHAENPVPGDPGGQARQKGYAKLNDGDAAAALADFAVALKANPKDADAMAGSGLAALQEKDYVSAEDSLSRAMALAPAKKSQWAKALDTAKFYNSYSQAEAAMKSGDLTGAEKLARPLAESNNADADVAKKLYADILSRQSNYPEAESLYRDVLRRHPQDASAIAGLAHVLSSEGHVEEASALVSSSPEAANNPSLRQMAANVAAAKADALAMNGNISQAEHAYEKSIAGDPTNPWIRLSYARLLLKTDAERQANGIMSPLVQSAEPGAEALYALAIFADETGDEGRASKYLQRIPESDRTDDMRKLAFKLQSQGAIASARKSGDPTYASSQLEDIAADPQATPGLRSQIAQTLYDVNPQAAIALARKEEDRGVSAAPLDYAGFLKVLSDAGLDAEARTFLLQIERHADESGNKAQATALRATLAANQSDHLRSDGRFADAYDLLAGALRDSPNDKELLLALGRLYDSGHMSDKARGVFDHLQKTYPDDADVLSASIDNAIADNDIKRAEQLIERAQQVHPRDPRLYVAMGRIAEARGKREDALKAYRAAQSLRAEEAQAGGAGANAPSTLQDRNPFRAGTAQNATPGAYFVADAGDIAARDSTDAPSGVTGAIGPQMDDRAQAAYVYVPAGRSAAPIFVPNAAIPVNAPGDALSADIDQRIARLERATKPYVSVEVATRDRSGEAGLSQMTEIDGTASYQGTLFGKGQFTASLQPVILDAGTPTSSAAARFGTNPTAAALAAASSPPVVPTLPTPDSQQASGLAVSLKYKIGTLTADLGTTPLGFWRFSPVGGIEWAPEIADNMHVQIGAERRAVTDSVLSYNGALDQGTGQRWGAVTQTGAHGGVSYDNGEGGAYFTARLGTLKGHSVASNSTIQADAGAYLRPYQKDDAEFQVGFNADFAHFKKNLRYFSWGQGGYFSPQSFVGLSLPLTYKDIQGRWSYSLQASPGLQYFHEDSSPYFPTDPTRQGQLDSIAAAASDPDIVSNYASQTRNGFGFAGSAQVNYALTPATSIGGGLKFNNFGDYNDTTANIFFKHTLGK